MAKIKTAEETTRNYARGNLRSFLDGAKNLNWLLSTIESSGVQGASLAEIFENYRDYENHARYEEAVRACRQVGLLR